MLTRLHIIWSFAQWNIVTFSFEILYLCYNALYDNVLICETSIPNVCYKFYQANDKKNSTQLKRASDGFYMKKYQI